MNYRVITRMDAEGVSQSLANWERRNKGVEPPEFFAYEGKAIVHTPNESGPSWLAAYQSAVAKVGELKRAAVTERMVVTEWAKARFDDFKIVEVADLPDREFRNAWQPDKNKGVTVTMPIARKLHAASIRNERNKRFAPLDAEYDDIVRGKEIGRNIDTAKAAKVDAKRQLLRDAPASVADGIEKAETLEELKATWPEALK